jgi:DNA-binding transcriptional ArsR family regulator
VTTNASFEAVALMEALADPSRRAIVDILCEHPTSVTDLADALPVSRPAVSQHLKVLKYVGLVTDRAVGTRRIYSVEPEALAAVRAYFDDFWQRSLMAFRLAAESSIDHDPEESREQS